MINAAILIRPTDAAIARAVASPMRLIVTQEDFSRYPSDRVWLIYCSGDADLEANIRTARPFADQHGKGLYVVQDNNDLFPMSALVLLTADDAYGPECYRSQGESVTDFRSRIGALTRWSSVTRLFMPAVGAYDRLNRLTEVEMAEAIIVCSEVASINGWDGAALFDVAGRTATLPDGSLSGGLDVHPKVQPYVDRWFGPAQPFHPSPPAPGIDSARRRKMLL